MTKKSRPGSSHKHRHEETKRCMYMNINSELGWLSGYSCVCVARPTYKACALSNYNPVSSSVCLFASVLYLGFFIYFSLSSHLSFRNQLLPITHILKYTRFISHTYAHLHWWTLTRSHKGSRCPIRHRPHYSHCVLTWPTFPPIMASFLRRHKEHDPPIGELPVPHGPETGHEHLHYPRRISTSYATDYEREIFSHLLRPDDAYTPEGVYWADLPWSQRFAFVNKVSSQETKAELKTIWAMLKQDPLSPFSWYFRNSVLPGAGLLLEGYVLFSIGNLQPLFAKVWKGCWGTHDVCDKNWVASVT